MKDMIIDYTDTNLISGVPNSYHLCECMDAPQSQSLSPETCIKCEGSGKVFVPFICLFNTGDAPCKEGFDTMQELSEHMMETHNAYPMTEQ